jgi:iron complex outermembrane receptor protein
MRDPFEEDCMWNRKMKTNVLRQQCLIAAVLLLTVSPVSVFADQPEPNDSNDLFEMSIEQLMDVEIDTVYAASKFEQKITEAPSSVTVISDREIQLYGYRTLADILNSIPGFYTTYDRNYGYIGVRGFGRPGDYNSRILVLIDGHRMNENISDSVSVLHDFDLDVDLIKKVEVVRGPGSALYGSNAFFAVINIITKSGSDYDGLELSGELAEHDSEKARITYGKAFNENVEALFSGTYYDRDGETLYYPEFAGTTNNDDEDSKSFFVKTSFSDFTFTATHVEREKGIPTAPWGTIYGDRRNRTSDERTTLGLSYEHSFADDFSMTSRISYSEYDYEGDYPFDDGGGGSYINHDVWKGRWWTGQLQFTKIFSDSHRVIFGGESQYNVSQDQKNHDIYGVYLDDKQHSKSWGVYIQDELHLTDKLILNTGIRQDYYDSFGFTVNPRVGLIYQALEDTTCKFLYGTAFRAPSAYELYYHDGGWTTKSNPDLEAEEIESFEVVLEQKINKTFSASISGYYNTIDDLIDLELDPGDGLLYFDNIGEVTAKGVEATVFGRWDNGAQAKTSYSYVRTHNKNTGMSLANSPKHMVNFNLIYPVIAKTLFAGIDTQWTGKRNTLDGNQTDDAFITNLTLTYDNLIDNLQVQVGIYNLFDETESHPGFDEHLQDEIEQDGRTFAMKLTYRF